MKLLTLLFYFKNRYNQIKVNLAFLSYITQIQRLPFKMKMMKLCEAEMVDRCKNVYDNKIKETVNYDLYNNI
jgi:hypothetical protein